MSFYKKNLGQLGENIALNFLTKNGYKILQRNLHSHWGEIDIIAKKDDKLSFIEVKTRIGVVKGFPHESINFFKLRSLKRAVQYYLLQNNLKDYKLTIDAISIQLDFSHKVQKILHFENIASL